MRRASEPAPVKAWHAVRRVTLAALRIAGQAAGAVGATASLAAAPSAASTPATCAHPVYLTIDTGHMGVAPLVADVLARQGVKATFFLANERTQAVGGARFAQAQVERVQVQVAQVFQRAEVQRRIEVLAHAVAVQ